LGDAADPWPARRAIGRVQFGRAAGGVCARAGTRASDRWLRICHPASLPATCATIYHALGSTRTGNPRPAQPADATADGKRGGAVLGQAKGRMHGSGPTRKAFTDTLGSTWHSLETFMRGLVDEQPNYVTLMQTAR